MAQQIAYGSLTIVDITDIGEFSVQPMSNLPLSVINDPDKNQFTPNWETNNLRITPAVYYAGEPLTLGQTGLEISWQRQVGVLSPTDITTGEAVVDDGVLSVTANQFTSSTTMLTYIVTATYREPTSEQTLRAQGQITFTLVKNASAVKSCSITGENVFKYNKNGTLTPSGHTITLSAKVNVVNITGWKYQNGNTWSTYPNSGISDTLLVKPTDSVFTNDRCVIKLETNDSSVYDIHTIVKLRDGADGSKTVSAVLTNDDQMIPYDTPSSTSPSSGFTSAISQIIIYEGSTDVTHLYTITPEGDGNVTFTSSKTNSNLNVSSYDTVTATAMSAGTANITFTCTRSNYDTLIKTFSLVKVTSGKPGESPVIYSVESDTLAINKTVTNPVAFTPASVTFNAYTQTGETKNTYNGLFEIYENTTLQQYKTYTTNALREQNRKDYSQSNTSSFTYTPTSSAQTILCVLYESGAFSKVLDTQMVVVTSDGQKGEQGLQGNDGANAVNVVLGNYADVLTCTKDNKLSAAQNVIIPFAAYEGTSRIACSFTSTKLLNVNPNAIGTSATSSKNATPTSDGQIVWTLPAAKEITTASGSISITFTATTSKGQVSVTENYSWSRNTAAKDGENSVMLQIFTPTGTNTLNQNITSTTLKAQLTDGATDKTTSASYQWAKFQSGTYSDISGATSSSYTVDVEDISSYASFRCTATYNNKPYVAYFSVFDKTDPIQVSVFSSVGNQLVNGVGCGALYVKVTRNGAEIDTIKSERFLEGDPASASNGDFYYKLDKTHKTVTLMKYTTSWVADNTNYYTGNYSWSWRDKDGNVVSSIGDNTLPTQGKVIYIDGSMVDGKIIADVEVTI